MCVIIYVPKGVEISIDEIINAWNTNPDGAGYSIQKDNKVHFKRGFMTLDSYLEEIIPLIGKYNLMLHFRISTSKEVNKVQTHPYKKGNVTLTEGVTDKPIICMNGIISGQRQYKDCNDTMSFIIDHPDAFEVANQDVVNLIEELTGAKWAIMKPNEVLLSSKFVKYENRYYSNRNHMFRTFYFNTRKKQNQTLNSMIKTKKLRDAIKRDKYLYEDVLDFIDIWCNHKDDMCMFCSKCLKKAKTLRDVKITINENWYMDSTAYKDNDESINALDYYYDDFYDYDYNNCCNTNLFDE